MRQLKTIVFILFSGFLGYQSYTLVSHVLNAPIVFSTAESLWIACLLLLFITGTFAFIGFVLPTHRLLGQGYYKIKNEKELTQIYRLIGGKYFRYLLLLFFWGRKKNRKSYFSGTKSGLQQLEFNSKQSEFGHLGAFVIIQIIVLILAFQGRQLLVSTATLLNILINFYPIILQRMHRYRINRITK